MADDADDGSVETLARAVVRAAHAAYTSLPAKGKPNPQEREWTLFSARAVKIGPLGLLPPPFFFLSPKKPRRKEQIKWKLQLHRQEEEGD